ncbi:MAG TPA: T9SS type A sorting domain-containing protein [Chitinophagaceae bacterium]|nr:T9SS type A sorting domain-containing protein [Chitinophagaceae bacterium]
MKLTITIGFFIAMTTSLFSQNVKTPLVNEAKQYLVGSFETINPGSKTFEQNYKEIVFKTADGGRATLLRREEKIVPEQENAVDLTIYPNPSTGVFNLETNASVIEEVTVLNILGEIVYPRKSVSAKYAVVDLSALPKGIYLVKAVISGQPISKRVVIF